METKTIEIVDTPTTAARHGLAPACSSVLLGATDLGATDLLTVAPARDWTTGLGGAIAPAVRSVQGTGLSSAVLSFGADDRTTGLPPRGAPV